MLFDLGPTMTLLNPSGVSRVFKLNSKCEICAPKAGHEQGGIQRGHHAGKGSTWAYDCRHDRAVHPQSERQKGIANEVNCGPTSK